jgi:hypothetical protein
MDIYSKTRGVFPVDYELGRVVSKYRQERRKQVLNVVKHQVVKIVCSDGNGDCVGFFNAFFYLDTEPLLLTAGHIVGWNGATVYTAVLQQRTESELCVQLGQPIKVGAEAGMQHTAQGVAFMSRQPDIAVFRCPQQPPVPPRCSAALIAATGDDFYSVGYKGVDEAQLVFSEGTITSVGLSGMVLSGCIDESFSGAPVFNSDGYLVGMVQGGDGTAIMQVNMVPTYTIHHFLQTGEPVLPGLRG